MVKKVWSSRFKEATKESAEDYTSSIAFDQRLYKFDILGSIAYAKALAKAKVLTIKEGKKIVGALQRLLKSIEAGRVKFKGELEDIHMNIESLLIQRIGEVGKKLHTGRSRNDQVATDLRMYIKEEINQINSLIKGLQKTIIDLAEKNVSVIMPGYTHLQKAQPVLLSHHLMAYFEMLERDNERLLDCFKRTDVLPLGSGALAGSNYPIDRESLAAELGFSQVSKNSIDAVGDRDFVIEFIGAASIIMMHLSRFSEELILWGTPEFNFIEIGDAYTTGSSLMPQKKNPDIPELIRGKTGRIFGHLASILTVLKGLPLAYNKDMQEDKEGLFDTIDTLKATLSIMREMLPTIKINAKEILAAASSGLTTATDLVDYLVKKGIPFREAHETVGKISRFALDFKKELWELTLREFQRFSSKIDEDVYQHISIEASVKGKDIVGGTAPSRVREAIRKAKEKLE